jgi:hypothetical protein
MPGLRPKLYAAALIGLALFGVLVVFDVMRPGALPSAGSLAVSLGLAVCGVAVIALRPRKKRRLPHEEPPRDFTAILEERRRLTEEAEKRPPRLPPT